MASMTWHTAIAAQRDRLITLGAVPTCLHRHRALWRMSVLCDVAASDLQVRLIANAIGVRMVSPDRQRPDLQTRLLLGVLQDAVTAAALGLHRQPKLFDEWSNDADLDGFVAATIEVDLDDSHRASLLRAVADAKRSILSFIDRLGRFHRYLLIRRDQAPLAQALESVTPVVLSWLLAVERDGASNRSDVLLRRRQALETFGCVFDFLVTKAVTAAIDAGEQLTPALIEGLGLTRAQARALVGSREPAETASGWRDRQFVIKALRDHEVPIHEWPGQGRPNRPTDWSTSPWMCTDDYYVGPGALVRADYFGEDPTQVRDAVRGFQKDLLGPILTARLARHDPRELRRQSERDVLARLDRCELLSVVRRALVGPRRPKAFQEAVALWHRRAAAVAALRDEYSSDRPGWPALCAPWRSTCGRYSVVALTTATELVEEGNAHQHCVGGYYDVCRQGDTQILSLRDHGQPVATIEILLGSDWREPRLTVAQFKGWHDAVAAPEYHPVLRQLLADVRTGVHAINGAALASYRQAARDRVASWRDDGLTLDFARRVYPLYRPLLPKPSPDSFDSWVVACGLVSGLDRLIGRSFTLQQQQPPLESA
jgi:hypothetical protein